MKKILLLLCLLAAGRCFALDGIETFRAGLQAFQANGPDALLHTWYSGDEQEKVANLRKRLVLLTENLGGVVDTEVFAPKDMGRHVQRLYGVIYFQKRPLWLRAEYYTIEGRGGFISLEFSHDASDILPIELNASSH
jgi:hypothetical protein